MFLKKLISWCFSKFTPAAYEIGGRGDDVIAGRYGRDRIFGRAGDDVLDGAGGNDVVFGGRGDDALYGGSGRDFLDGGKGDDWLRGGSGSDHVEGGKGDDTAVYVMTDNAGSRDVYEGGKDTDILRLELTGAEWARADVQQDVRDYLDFIADHTNRRGIADGKWFAFTAFGLKAREFEHLKVVVDGVEIDPEAPPPNQAPTEIALDGAPVRENEKGWVVGALSVVDPDAGDTHVLTVSDARFEIAGNVLKLKDGVALDFEAAPAVSVEVTATDAGGLSRTETVVVNVEDVPDTATQGDDLLAGSSGADVIDGLAGDNLLDGGDGDDILRGGNGANTVLAGAGADQVFLGDGDNTVDGGDGGDVVEAGDGDNDLTGGAGDDDLAAGDGDNRVYAGLGNDRVDLGDGDNEVEGGDGEDDDIIFVGDGDNEIRGGAGDDDIETGWGENFIDAGDGDDFVTLDDGGAVVIGGAGDDDIWAFGGDNAIDAGAGDDIVETGDGDDAITGGLGADSLIGGGGRDVFIYRADEESGVGAALRDVIDDFDAGGAGDAVDVLDFSAFAVGDFAFLGGETADFDGAGSTQARFNDATKILEIDADGDAQVDMEIELTGTDGAALDDGDFVTAA